MYSRDELKQSEMRARFGDEQLRFGVREAVLDAEPGGKADSVEAVLAADHQARERARTIVERRMQG